MLTPLPNNRLILNGHKLHSCEAMFAYITKRLKLAAAVSDFAWLTQVLKQYNNLTIAVQHADTFLQDETATSRNQIIKQLEKIAPIKITIHS